MRSASDVSSPHPRAGARACCPGFWAILALLSLSFSGCDWLNRPAGDLRREGNYQDGLRWADQGRWDNARESFYRALETNPQHLLAHLALGDLYRARLTNQVLALYHYHRYLELGRSQNNGEFRDQSAADGIRNAEVELARGYAERMFRDQQQYELDNLRRTNSVLLQRIDVLNHHIGLLSRQVASQTNPLVAPPAERPRLPLPDSPAQPVTAPLANRGNPQGIDPRRNVQTTPTQPAQPTQPATARTHRVASGETLSTIARQYRVGVPALQSANPTVDARRLRPGQMLVIPTR
jgi:LysM repeat protein